jgi:hypothetical protein
MIGCLKLVNSSGTHHILNGHLELPVGEKQINNRCRRHCNRLGQQRVAGGVPAKLRTLIDIVVSSFKNQKDLDVHCDAKRPALVPNPAHGLAMSPKVPGNINGLTFFDF